MESKLTISVAIATYNRAAMVRNTVEAALAQSRPPIEVVVADDASTDATAEVLATLARGDSRVRVLRQPKNSGGVGNWNLAMRETSGDLIAWCSDDDWFRPGHLEESAAFLEAHPEVGLVHSHFVDFVESPLGDATEFRRQRSPRPLWTNAKNLLRYLNRYYDWPFHPSTIVMRRRVWEEVGAFDPGYQLADTDWFVRAVERFPAVLLPRYGVNNRRHVGNWSNRVGSARMQREIFEIVERSLHRHWPRWTLGRSFWKFVWRMNVRLRLLLTLCARIRGGHADAAYAAWSAFCTSTGRSMPEWIAAKGDALIRARLDRFATSSASSADGRGSLGRPLPGSGPSVRPL
ncbi:MAG: glycosyltransferase family 2 protein [Bryobacteraceae bacterium]